MYLVVLLLDISRVKLKSNPRLRLNPLRNDIIPLQTTFFHNKLHDMKFAIGDSQSLIDRVKVIWDRLRIGHTRLTHSFLLKWEPPPECTTCGCQLTIQQ